MNKYGFTDKEWNDTLSILKKHNEIEKVVLFGSRAKNTFKSMSDVDIVLFGDKISHSLIAGLQSDFEDSQIPYFFDIIADKTITSNELKKHICIYGKTILGSENNVPEGWVETTLGKVCDPKGGKRLPKGETLILEKTTHPYIRITDFNGNSVNKNNLQFVPDETFDKISRYIVNKNDVIISIVGTIGLIARIDNELNNANLTENCVKLINLKKVNYNYLFYYLTSSIGQYEINKNTVGAVQKKLPIYGVQNINITLPPLQEQVAIAKTLTVFDDKIENLQAQNKTLETTAQTIFKEWFGKYQIGDVLPDGWRVGKLGELIEIKYGKDHKHLKDGKFPLYGSGGIMRFVEKSLYDKDSILIPRKGTLSNLFYLTKPFWSVDTMFYSEIKNSFQGRFVFLFLKSINLSSMNVGSAVPSLTTQVLNQIPIVIPKDSVVIEFDKITSSLYEKMELNSNQIKTLKKTRDTLLPKLMSGSLRVKMSEL